MKSVLLDSSVLVKWFIEEQNSDLATALQRNFIEQKIELAYAELSLFEIANALHYSGLFTVEDIIASISALEALGMQCLAYVESTLSRAIELVVQHGITIYDSYLIALAEQYSIDFVTADGRLLRKVSQLPFVYDLRSYKVT